MFRIGHISRLIVIFYSAAWLAGCTTTSTAPLSPYSKAVRSQLYDLQQWSLDGRLALNAGKESWSANLLWQHDPKLEHLKLSGPLGQGAADIKLEPGRVVIDRGGKDVQTSNNPEQFINQQLGLSVPIHSLSYWVVGVPEPSTVVFETDNGFKQGDWIVTYKEMQLVGKRQLPKKMVVMNDQVRVKIMIDQWNIDAAKPE